MVKRGGGGKIINISSQAGRRGEALVSMYCAAKAAVISLTQSAGLDLIKHRINVNCIAPGVIDTPMWDRVDALFARYEHRPIGEKKRLAGEAVPYGRMGVPDDQTGAAVFLASSDSDYVVAQTLNVDGGNRIKGSPPRPSESPVWVKLRCNRAAWPCPLCRRLRRSDSALSKLGAADYAL